MAKNIIIYSDGTGQRGGVTVDENRSNIYKLYRATRCGPDTCIDAAKQLAYYDPGIGTAPPGLSAASAIWRKIQNTVSQATGLGLTLNITDCYMEILKVWEPGDRIYVMGFSRGAYTVRCLSAVLHLCGVPTLGFDGKPLKRDPASLRKMARFAIKNIYQYVCSPRDYEKYGEQRRALAAQFRQKYGSRDAEPYFIGVFDTVSAMSRIDFALLGLALGLVILAIASVSYFGLVLGGTLLKLAFAVFAATALWLLWTNARYARGLPGYSFWQTFHITSPVMRFANNQLSDKVMYARHAQSIDENRASFARVGWGNPASAAPRDNWLRQIWFAGDHSDIGGSYPENESRLSDISLGWMVAQIEELPEPLEYEKSLLRLSPNSTGMQHDECKSSTVFRHGKKAIRKIPHDAPLHPSVIERFKTPAVLQYDVMAAYRPEALRCHNLTKGFY